STHAAQLANLLLRTTGAGVGHDVDRVHSAVVVGPLHVGEHLVGHLVRDQRPHLDDLVGTFAVGDGAVHILLLNFDHLLVGFVDDGVFAGRDDHVVKAHGKAGTRGVVKAQRL